MASWPVDAMGAIRILSVFLGVTKGLLTVEQRHGNLGTRRLGLGQVAQNDLGALQPFLVGMLRSRVPSSGLRRK